MKSIALVLIVIAVISVSGAVATFYVVERQIAQEDREFSFEQELWEIEKRRVTDSLGGVISEREIRKGFWFEYMSKTGEIELVFVSVEDLAGQRLSRSELEQVVTDLDNGRIMDADSAMRRSEEELSQNLQFHNGIYASLSGGESTKDMLETLEGAQKPSSADLSSLAYLYELEGDYAARDAAYEDIADICQSSREQLTVIIRGTVVDLKGEPVQGATIDVLGTNEATVRTDVTGSYATIVSTFVPGKLRISALKRNFSDGVVSVNTVSKDKTVYEADPIVIAGAVSVVTIDTQNKTVSGSASEVRQDGTFVVRTDQSVYEIPGNALVHENGTLYQGEADV